MLGKIYLKLYLSFLLIFVVTLLIVGVISARFYASRVREEVGDYFESHARFLQSEYSEACAPEDRWRGPKCQQFLRNLEGLLHLRIWIVDRSGNVLFSHQAAAPKVNSRDFQRAASGEIVTLLRRRMPPHMIVPVIRSGGTIRELLILERPFHGRRHLPRFPFLFSLIVAGVLIAILVLPLSLRLTRSLRQLHGLAQEWAEGRLEKRANISGKDEIADLAAVFNTMAENLQKMLGQRKEFLAFISHELKSPLARMRVALELLSEKAEEGSETKKLVANMQGEITESEKLIDQLLLLSKIEMSLPASLNDSTDLTSVLDRAFDQVRPLAESSGVVLQNHSGFDRVHVRADAPLLQRAIANVLENAVKFSPPGGIVEVRSNRENNRVVFQFIDRGPGIHPQDLEKIFQPFYRAATAEKKEGSGLGLFLAKRIIEIHRGIITASANQPSGTVVSIELPESPQ